MGDHRAGVPGSTDTTLADTTSTTSTESSGTAGRRAARHSSDASEPRTSQPYAGRRVATVAPLSADAVRGAEALPYTGRRVAGRNAVVARVETAPTGAVGRRIALDAELTGLDGDAEDVVGHLLRPTAAPTLEAYAGRRAARPDLITEPLMVRPVPADRRPTEPVSEPEPTPRPAPPVAPIEVREIVVAPVVDVVEEILVVEADVETLVVTGPQIEAPLVELPVLEDLVLAAPAVAEPEVAEPVVAEPVIEEPVALEAAELVEPVLAAHPELSLDVAPLPAARPAARPVAKRTRPVGRRVASRRTRVPSLPLLAGIAVLAISAGGALQAVNPGLAGADAGGRISPASALSGSSAVGSANLLGGRSTSVSRDSDRTSGDSLQAAADAQAKERDAALSAYASQAQKRAAQIKLHQWVLPVAAGVYHLTARFGDYSSLWSHFHTGLDFAAPTGTPIMAVAGGTISEVGYSGAYGNRTIETLPDGTELWYCHQNEFGTSVGATVKPGQVIGYVGSTGNVTGPHLHLEVHPGGGDPVDPFTALQVHGLNP
jgi:murein DD-endopeptidase MepM/ murein hydrolase activator NlpD